MIAHRTKTFILFVGDAVLLYLSLALVLALRYLPTLSEGVVVAHLFAFSFVIGLWLLSFFIAGLYEPQIIFSRRSFMGRLAKTQIANSIIAVLFFYLIPFFEIAPKTNLFLYLVVSFVLVFLWRIYSVPLLGRVSPQKAVVIAGADASRDLVSAINRSSRYGLEIIASHDPRMLDDRRIAAVCGGLVADDIAVVIIDTESRESDRFLRCLYGGSFPSVKVISLHELYEEVSEHMYLPLINERWLVEHISSVSHPVYDACKRIMDAVAALILLVLTLPIYPLIIVASLAEGRGPVFFRQVRIGEHNRPITIVKFRSMAKEDGGVAAVTKLGAFLRKTRIDELPQLWNVVKGDLSLIGPRPEIPALVREYEQKIPYYGIRHLIKPGLSGWAQLYHENHPHHGSDVVETRMKLSYDLYYLKHRSFLLDIVIALKTVRTFIARSGR